MNHNEVRNILVDWLNGSLDSHEWDDFISVKNKDAELETIRQRASGIWIENSEFLQIGAIDPCKLSELGRTEVAEMISTMPKAGVNGHTHNNKINFACFTRWTRKMPRASYLGRYIKEGTNYVSRK